MAYRRLCQTESYRTERFFRKFDNSEIAPAKAVLLALNFRCPYEAT